MTPAVPRQPETTLARASVPGGTAASVLDPALMLSRNSAQYERMVKFIRRLNWRRDPERSLQFIRVAADFATHHHSGRFTDGAIENILLDIGRLLDTFPGEDGGAAPTATAPARRGVRRHIIHVITHALGGGGPTRTIKNWIDLDLGSCSSVVLVNQQQFEVPRWLEESVTRSGGALVRLPPQLSLLGRAKWLREIRRSADLIILHTYTDDVVPAVAFATPGGPPVAIVNHSDHLFWLNRSVGDVIVHQRAISTELGPMRFAREEVVLPIPLGDPDPTLTRAGARRRLGIPDGQTVLLSVGSVWKLFPTEVHNFRATVQTLLDRNPDVHLYLLAWDWGFKPDFLYEWRHDRVHFFPNHLDASLYQAAADVYLEGFPFGSQTALLEACMCALPVVRAYAPAHRLLVADDPAISGVIDSPATEQDYISRVERFIRDPQLRMQVGGELRTSVAATHLGDNWKRQLAVVYGRLTGLSHAPTPLPETRCAASKTDLAVCAFQQAKFTYEQMTGGGDGAPLADKLLSEASKARRGRQYRLAFTLLRCLGTQEGQRARAMQAMLKLVLHNLLSWLSIEAA